MEECNWYTEQINKKRKPISVNRGKVEKKQPQNTSSNLDNEKKSNIKFVRITNRKQKNKDGVRIAVSLEFYILFLFLYNL